MLTKPLAPAESVVTNAELAAWLVVEEDDPLLPLLSLTATISIINYLEMELISRQREVLHRLWPTIGTDTSPSLSRPDQFLSDVIELPFSVESVTIDEALIYGESVTLEAIEDRPFIVCLSDNVYAVNDCDTAIKITYTTGYADINSIPADIKQAALSVAAYMYEHRGECDAMQALERSGAKDLIQHYKINLVVF